VDDASTAHRLARALRHLPDQLLHRLRRRALRRRLAVRAPIDRFLFVCHGNICRSPYAAAVANRLLSERGTSRIHADSAGFFGPDRPSPDTAVEVARERGLDLGAHRSKLVTPELVRTARLIIVMDPSQRATLIGRYGRADDIVVMGDLDPEPCSRRAIRDPVEQPREVFAASYSRIERCVAALVGTIVR